MKDATSGIEIAGQTVREAAAGRLSREMGLPPRPGRLLSTHQGSPITPRTALVAEFAIDLRLGPRSRTQPGDQIENVLRAGLGQLADEDLYLAANS